jgi:hypothetical protein
MAAQVVKARFGGHDLIGARPDRAAAFHHAPGLRLVCGRSALHAWLALACKAVLG